MRSIHLLNRGTGSRQLIRACLLFAVATWRGVPAQSAPSYGQWTSWSQCSVTCADGVRFRYRQCPHARHDPAYRHCPGEPLMFQDCHNTPCIATLQPVPAQPTTTEALGGVVEIDLDCDFECAPDDADCSQLDAACRTSKHDPATNSAGKFFGGKLRRRRSIDGRAHEGGAGSEPSHVVVGTVLLSVGSLAVVSVACRSCYACRKTRTTCFVDVGHYDIV